MLISFEILYMEIDRRFTVQSESSKTNCYGKILSLNFVNSNISE